MVFRQPSLTVSWTFLIQISPPAASPCARNHCCCPPSMWLLPGREACQQRHGSLQQLAVKACPHPAHLHCTPHGPPSYWLLAGCSPATSQVASTACSESSAHLPSHFPRACTHSLLLPPTPHLPFPPPHCLQDVKPASNVTGRPNSLQLKTSSGGSVCYITDTETELVEWMSAIEGAVQRICRHAAGERIGDLAIQGR